MSQLNPALASQVVNAIRAVTDSEASMPVALHEPSFGGNEWVYLKACLDSTFVSSVGKFVDQFEADLVNFTGAKHAIAVVNGTSALHIALQLVGVISGDEVLIPALTFVATANAVSYCNATPHFIDSEPTTLGIDALKLRDYLSSHTRQEMGRCLNCETGRVIRAIVPMHTFGHPVDLEALLSISHDFNIALVEDAAESLGSYYQGKHTGTFGKLGVLSFNGNKIVTTGGGGAILTDDSQLAKRAKHLTTTAKITHAWEFFHDEVGYNYRLPNLNAALGCAQLEQLPGMLSAKRRLYEKYHKEFLSIPGISLFQEPLNCHSNYWLQTLILDPSSVVARNAILSATNEAGLMTRPAWTLINDLVPYKSNPRMDLTGAQLLSKSIINIPSSSNLMLGRS